MLRALMGVVLGAAASGCATAVPQGELRRAMAGQTRVGSFVPPFAYEAYVRGELALARGDAQAAVRAFGVATAAPEEDPYLLSRLAWAASLAGDAGTASRSLARAAELDRCSEPFWTTRAQLAERRGDLGEARTAYAQAMRCAPRSPVGPLGLARVLAELGDRGRASSVLQSFAAHADWPSASDAALELALANQDSVAAAVALEGVLAHPAPRAERFENAIERALGMDRPWLAARIAEHVRSPLPKALAARVCLACGDVRCAQAALGTASTEDLGGAAPAAELLVQAELFERAELEASVALQGLPSPRLSLARARARAGLSDLSGAASDLAHLPPAEDARTELGTLLGRAGLGGLADEVAAGRLGH